MWTWSTNQHGVFRSRRRAECGHARTRTRGIRGIEPIASQLGHLTWFAYAMSMVGTGDPSAHSGLWQVIHDRFKFTMLRLNVSTTLRYSSVCSTRDSPLRLGPIAEDKWPWLQTVDFVRRRRINLLTGKLPPIDFWTTCTLRRVLPMRILNNSRVPRKSYFPWISKCVRTLLDTHGMPINGFTMIVKSKIRVFQLYSDDSYSVCFMWTSSMFGCREREHLHTPEFNAILEEEIAQAYTGQIFIMGCNLDCSFPWYFDNHTRGSRSPSQITSTYHLKCPQPNLPLHKYDWDSIQLRFYRKHLAIVKRNYALNYTSTSFQTKRRIWLHDDEMFVRFLNFGSLLQLSFEYYSRLMTPRPVDRMTNICSHYLVVLNTLDVCSIYILWRLQSIIPYKTVSSQNITLFAQQTLLLHV